MPRHLRRMLHHQGLQQREVLRRGDQQASFSGPPTFDAPDATCLVQASHLTNHRQSIYFPGVTSVVNGLDDGMTKRGLRGESIEPESGG